MAETMNTPFVGGEPGFAEAVEGAENAKIEEITIKFANGDGVDRDLEKSMLYKEKAEWFRRHKPLEGALHQLLD